MLDLSGACLSELIEVRTACSSAAEPSDRDRTPGIVSVFSKKKPGKDAKHSAIFGQPLGQCAIDCISLILDFLAQPENVKQEGLFRKAGNVDRQRVLCDRLNSTETELSMHEFSVHDCATVPSSK